MDDFPQPTVQATRDAPARPRCRCWFRRLLVLVLLVLAVAVGAFSWVVHNTRSAPPYSTALALIQADPELRQRLGEPIRDLRWLPTSGYPKQFQMQVQGPQGKADISVTAGEFGGKWELTALDARVYPADDPHGTAIFLSLDTGRSTDDAPTWQPGGSSAGDPPSGETGLQPPAGVNLEPPAADVPGVNIELPGGTPDMNIQLPPAAGPSESPRP
ncbi:MAG: Coa1/Tim21 domain-containing protein [Thermoguttaceae bacterium]